MDTSPSPIFMHRALQLATLGHGLVSPNPMVGCVVVYDEKIIGEGWHKKYGDWHAEVNAINDAINRGFEHLLQESTVYVTLEPCSHFGKTPPCADLLAEKRVKEVVICNHDPNPLVAGKGIEKLQQAGIKVEVGLLQAEGLALNKRFFTFIEKKRPYIILKWAETADGFIATKDKKPLAISSLEAQVINHKWRTEEDAILVGTNTAQNDNPRLSARLWAGRNPVRLVIDRTLRLDKDLHLFDQSQPTICYNEEQNKQIDNNSFVQISFDNNLLINLLADLYQRKIQSVIVEGGAMLLESFLHENLFDEIRIVKSLNAIGRGTAAPQPPIGIALQSTEKLGADTISIYHHNSRK